MSIDPVTMLDMDMNQNYFNRYTYTFNDPVNAIDPTGMYIVFSERTSDEDLDTFTDYIAASDIATSLLNTLSGVEAGCTIDISTENTYPNGSPRSHYAPNSRVIHINLTNGAKIESGGVITPASGGVHEMGHAVQHVIAGSAKTFENERVRGRDTADSKGNIIKRAISSNESDATSLRNSNNRQMGEPTRKNYNDGRPFITCGLTSTEAC